MTQRLGRMGQTWCQGFAPLANRSAASVNTAPRKSAISANMQNWTAGLHQAWRWIAPPQPIANPRGARTPFTVGHDALRRRTRAAVLPSLERTSYTGRPHLSPSPSNYLNYTVYIARTCWEARVGTWWALSHEHVSIAPFTRLGSPPGHTRRPVIRCV
jgi:hypothetical protein